MYRIFLAFICLTLAACGGNDGTTSTPDQGILADVGPVEDTGPDGGIQMQLLKRCPEVERKP